MTFDEFVKKYSGSRIDYDNFAYIQCTDLARIYSKEVLGEDMDITITGYAEGYYTHPTAKVKELYTLIPNTPTFVPKKGDVAIWSSALNGAAGHIAVCNGEGNTEYFYSYDYNWKGQNDGWTKVKHTYSCVLGVLRPKDQTKVNGKEVKILETSGYKKGDKTIGVYAFKKLLMLAYAKKIVPKKLANDSVFGGGTITNVNTLLKKWGYKQTGIAGKKFIEKLYEEVLKKI